MSQGRKTGMKLLATMTKMRRDSKHSLDLEAMGLALDDRRLREEEDSIFDSHSQAHAQAHSHSRSPARAAHAAQAQLAPHPPPFPPDVQPPAATAAAQLHPAASASLASAAADDDDDVLLALGQLPPASAAAAALQGSPAASAAASATMLLQAGPPSLSHHEDLVQPQSASKTLFGSGRRSVDVVTTLEARPDDFTAYPEETLAQNMTLVDFAEFVAIEPSELENGNWLRDDKATLAPHIVKLTQRFNDTSHWVKREILYAPTDEARSDRITRFIRIAKKFYEFNNLHSLLAVLSGLQSAPVYRLRRAWQGVKDKVWERFQKLQSLTSEEQNYKAMRDHIKGLKAPAIPYLGMYLTDLTHLRTAMGESQTPQKCEEEASAIMAELQSFQKGSYPFSYVRFVLDYLEKEAQFNIQPSSAIDRELFKRSKEIEPRRSETDDASAETAAQVQRTVSYPQTSGRSQGATPLHHSAGASPPNTSSGGLLTVTTPSHRVSFSQLSLGLRRTTPTTFGRSTKGGRETGHRKTRSLGNTAALFGPSVDENLLSPDQESSTDFTNTLVAGPSTASTPLPTFADGRLSETPSQGSSQIPAARLKTSIEAADPIPSVVEVDEASSLSDEEEDSFPPSDDFGRGFGEGPSTPGAGLSVSVDYDTDAAFGITAAKPTGLSVSADDAAAENPPRATSDLLHEGILRIRLYKNWSSYKYYWGMLYPDRLVLYPQLPRVRDLREKNSYSAKAPQVMFVTDSFSVTVDSTSKHHSFYVYPRGAGTNPLKFQGLSAEHKDEWVRKLSQVAKAPRLGPFNE